MSFVNLLTHDVSSMSPVYRGKLVIDADPLASRFAVWDRLTGQTLYMGKTDVTALYLPFSLTAEQGRALVCILDDTREFNAEILDGVKLDIVDVTSES